MKTIIAKGKTVEEAIANGLDELGAVIEDVSTKVLEVPASGLIGVFGNKYAKVELTLRDDATDRTLAFLSELFDAMNIKVEIKTSMDDGIIVFDLITKNAGVLIGKRGQTLDALQYLTSLVMNKVQSKYIRVALDIEDYREKRKRALQDLADRIALTVEAKKSRHELEPMNPYERRIIHSSLQNYKNIITYSEGEEPNRHVIIEYKREV
jgi:spoIIIJ-associated protein